MYFEHKHLKKDGFIDIDIRVTKIDQVYFFIQNINQTGAGGLSHSSNIISFKGKKTFKSIKFNHLNWINSVISSGGAIHFFLVMLEPCILYSEFQWTFYLNGRIFHSIIFIEFIFTVFCAKLTESMNQDQFETLRINN